MSERHILETILTVAVVWLLIAFAVRDLVSTAHRCLSERSSNFVPHLPPASGDWLVDFSVFILKKFNRRTALLKRLHLIVPFLQIVIWKAALVFGFAFLYLTIGRQSENETIPDDPAFSLWLSFAVSFRFVFDEPALHDPLLRLIANVQIYAGFLFFGFVGFYLMMLRQKAGKLKPRLYKLKFETNEPRRPPHALAESLREYSPHNLLLILESWERWAEELQTNLRAHRHFIYGGVRNEQKTGWLETLNSVLDACAALMVASGNAIEKQASRTFGAAHRALVEISELTGAKTAENKIVSSAVREPRDEFSDDEILSAQLLFEDEKTFGNAGQAERLGVRRLSYEKYLIRLADELETEIPLVKNDRKDD